MYTVIYIYRHIYIYTIYCNIYLYYIILYYVMLCYVILYYIILLYMAMFNRTIIFPNLPTWPWVSRFFRFGLRIWLVMTPRDPLKNGGFQP